MKTTTTKPQFAIASARVPSLDCVAVCEVWSYDVWGNARDGWEVNDRSCMGRAFRIPARAELCNAPRRPGASDRIRTFPDDSNTVKGFEDSMFVSWSLEDRDIRAAVGGKGWSSNGDGDGMNYYFEFSNGKPAGELRIIGWEDRAE